MDQSAPRLDLFVIDRTVKNVYDLFDGVYSASKAVVRTPSLALGGKFRCLTGNNCLYVGGNDRVCARDIKRTSARGHPSLGSYAFAFCDESRMAGRSSCRFECESLACYRRRSSGVAVVRLPLFKCRFLSKSPKQSSLPDLRVHHGCWRWCLSIARSFRRGGPVT